MTEISDSTAREIVYKAFRKAQELHAGQKDCDGKDYFLTHVLQVYFLVKECAHKDDTLLCAALLHDTIEDTDYTYEQMLEDFGAEIADLVMEVTQEGCKDAYGYYFPRLKSKRGIMLKFADRLSNLSRMSSWPEGRQQQYLKRSKFWKDGSDKSLK